MTGFSNTNKNEPNKSSSNDIKSLTSRATALHQSGHLYEAEALYLSIIRKGAASAAILTNLGVIYKSTNRLEEAICAYQKAVSLDPKFSDAYVNLGSIINEQGDIESAISYTRKAIDLNPQNALAYHNLGVYYKQKSELDLALQATLYSLKLRPEHGPAHLNLGLTLLELNEPKKALPAVLVSLRYMPDNIPSLLALAAIYKDLSRFPEASQTLQKVLKLDPESAAAYCNLGILFHMQNQLDQALEAALRSISIDPTNAMSFRSLGAIFRDRGALKDALSAAAKAIELSPSDPVAYMNYGTICAELCMFADAEAYTSKAIELNPGYEAAKFNLSQHQLISDDYRHGWANYRFREQRFIVSNLQCDNSSQLGEWNGEREQHVLLVGDQGIGDQILFASMVGEMQRLCSYVSLKVDRRLVPIFRRSFSGNIDIASKEGLQVGDAFDSYVSLGDLGHYFRRDSADFVSHPNAYLLPDSDKALLLKSKFKADRKALIGLSWNSVGPKYYNRKKCVPLSLVADRLGRNGLEFVSLQYGDCLGEILSAQDQLSFAITAPSCMDLTNDIDGLASLISACDAVITISNVTAHLAGALGIDTYLLVPASPHFYWGLQSHTTVWYKSIKVYRQSPDGSWDNALDQIAASLRDTI